MLTAGASYEQIFNLVVLLGRVYRVQFRWLAGQPLLTFTLKCKVPWVNEESEGRKSGFKIHLVSCRAWGKVAEHGEPFVKPGARVLLYGSVVTRKVKGKRGEKDTFWQDIEARFMECLSDREPDEPHEVEELGDDDDE